MWRSEHMIDQLRFRSVAGGTMFEQLDEERIRSLFARLHDGNVQGFDVELGAFLEDSMQRLSVKTAFFAGLYRLLEVATLGMAVVARLFLEHPDFAALHLVLLLAIESSSLKSAKRFRKAIRSHWNTVVERCDRILETFATQILVDWAVPFDVGLDGNTRVFTQIIGTMHLPKYKSLFEEALTTADDVSIPSVWCGGRTHRLCEGMMRSERIVCAWDEGAERSKLIEQVVTVFISTISVMTIDQLISASQVLVRTLRILESNTNAPIDLQAISQAIAATHTDVARDGDTFLNPFDNIGDVIHSLADSMGGA